MARILLSFLDSFCHFSTREMSFTRASGLTPLCSSKVHIFYARICDSLKSDNFWATEFQTFRMAYFAIGILLLTVLSCSSNVRAAAAIETQTTVHQDVQATKPIIITDSKTGEVFAKQFYYNPAENGLLNWYDSMQWCQQRRYEPGRVESAAENQLVANTLNQNFATSRVFWLGATDWGQDGQFYWLRTGVRFSYHSFAAGYPNGGPDESCAYVWGDGNWYDQYCTVAEVRPLCQLVTRIR